MYQSTCHILPWLEQLSSPEIAANLAEHFDVVDAIREFFPRTNVITGSLGRTRMLEALKQQAGASSCLPRPSLRVAPEMSSGQMRRTALLALLEIQPEGTALLIDAFLESVDTATGQEVLRLLAHHGKQVIVTVRPRMVDMVRQVLVGSEIVYVD